MINSAETDSKYHLIPNNDFSLECSTLALAILMEF